MLEIEKRDIRGLTALMKAAVQGRNECVTALLMAGVLLSQVSWGIARPGPSLGKKRFLTHLNILAKMRLL